MLESKLIVVQSLFMGVAFLTGCHHSEAESESDKVLVHSHQGSGQQHITVNERIQDDYITVNIVDHPNDLKKITEILENAKWEEKLKVEREQPPKYRFRFNQSNYAFWVTPTEDQLEIVIEGGSKFIQLPQKESETIFKIITGNELHQQ